MPDIERELRLLAENKIDCVVIGGIAARAHGSSHETSDLDVCYARDPENLNRLAIALRSVHATLRGALKDVPFRLDAETLRHGLNFTFDTDFGALDILGEVRGIGGYSECLEDCVQIEIIGRPKDLAMLPELEAILEYQKLIEAGEI